ncbi:hypothetical protein [Staphylococcus marylandisciuri]|uniref:hypothetical protein n=1 Tax=Staphylococcus marylandisciuri TaxID=2981529 RepID=UPI0021D1646B|nr:hypothetical protein [Staphylococcus marylandisciuri]
MPGRDYEIILFKLDFCPAPNKHSKLGWGPNKEKLIIQFLQALRVGVAPTQRGSDIKVFD